jgi:hypothetical protein
MAADSTDLSVDTLLKERERLVAQASAITGALQFCDYLIRLKTAASDVRATNVAASVASQKEQDNGNERSRPVGDADSAGALTPRRASRSVTAARAGSPSAPNGRASEPDRLQS